MGAAVLGVRDVGGAVDGAAEVGGTVAAVPGTDEGPLTAESVGSGASVSSASRS